MKKLIIYFCLIPICFINAYSQADKTISLSNSYLGQKTPGVIPELFAPGIISSKDYVESNCLVWDNGNHILVFRIGIGKLETFTTGDTWDSLKLTSEWGGPTLLHAISPNGNVMYYNYFGDTPNGAKHKSAIIFKKEKSDGKWSDNIDLQITGMWPSVDLSENLYYTTRINGFSCIAKRLYNNGSYLDEEILQFPNPEKIEFMHPCIAYDGSSYIIMDAERSPHENGCELYVSFKKKDESWTKPQNMGDYIPLKGAAMARLSSDGKYIFFQAEGDIYWVSSKIIEELKPRDL